MIRSSRPDGGPRRNPPRFPADPILAVIHIPVQSYPRKPSKTKNLVATTDHRTCHTQVCGHDPGVRAKRVCHDDHMYCAWHYARRMGPSLLPQSCRRAWEVFHPGPAPKLISALTFASFSDYIYAIHSCSSYHLCSARTDPSRAMTSIISFEPLQTFVVSTVHGLRLVDVAYTLGTLYAVLKVAAVVRCRLKTTALRGPPNPCFVWGIGKVLLSAPESGAVYEKWAEEYGGVYEVPAALGGRKIVLCDPKAIAHLYAGEPWSYTLTPSGKIATEHLVSRILEQRSVR